MQDQLNKIIFEQDEVTWQSMMMDIMKSEQMDPWDIDLKVMSEKFMDTLKQMKEMDFRVSGKIILASAILLRLKSYRFLDTDILELDKIIAGDEMSEADFYEGLEDGFYDPSRKLSREEQYKLIPRTPQPRKRKVSIYDLVGALNKALEVKQRRVMNSIPEMRHVIPKNTVDISVVIKTLYGRIKGLFKSKDKILFSELIPSTEKQDKVMTFIPLLHLTNQRKVDLAQQKHFGDIEISLHSKKEVEKELAA